MPLMPIDKSTIKYGSNDAGATVHDDDEILSKKMEEACKRLNIAGHTTGLRADKKVTSVGIELWTETDLI